MARSTENWVRGRTIGRGAFGTVSLAFGVGGRVFAVKSVALNSADRASVLELGNEIRILKCLSSPDVVEYLGDDTTEEATSGGACRNLHMEYLPGGTAADLAAASRRGKGYGVDEVELRAYTRCVAQALCYLHDVAGVVHCDVKGRNVLLGLAPGVAKLADFGAAVRVSDGNWRNRSARGTPLWMAPEVARGERPRPESDVWSLGCTVIEMVTGAQPWANWTPEDAAEAMFRIGYCDEVPEFPTHLSKLGVDFLAKCLKRDASERWTAEQLLQHPFLSEAEAPMEKSPRGVLDWANPEFDDGDCDGESSSVISSSYSDSTDWMHCGRERVRELASCDQLPNWDSGGWEQVQARSADEVLVERSGREEEQEMFWEHTNCCSVGFEDTDASLREKNGSEMRCSAASPSLCSCSSYCYYCVSDLSCCECDSSFQQLPVLVNGILFIFSFDRVTSLAFLTANTDLRCRSKLVSHRLQRHRHIVRAIEVLHLSYAWEVGCKRSYPAWW